MKIQLLFLLFFPFIIFSQNVEVEGGLIVDSLNVSSGKIKNLGDPTDESKNTSVTSYLGVLWKGFLLAPLFQHLATRRQSKLLQELSFKLLSPGVSLSPMGVFP